MSGLADGLFSRMCAKYNFQKPNDRRALDLMNAAAKAVVVELPEVIIAYGVSDEFSFVFHKSCALFQRRGSKLVSTVVSTFTANYVHSWPIFFPEMGLSLPLPTFDGRAYELVEPGSPLMTQHLDDLAESRQQSKTQAEKDKKKRAKARVVVEHLDIIKDEFWERRPWILSNKPGKAPKEP
ncbi:tRNA(His) guanylyltransferase [Moelleriella libera RCEF 2490]|uniref:tRNA(His) guanylyltransferase n=1 Tax=Moelleriella libera RCEF 2490 TaxID=1081109 RepID=A0A168ADA5_9HYPO|nr:tRNA(His) guanylyltransferase [Moelleriella libera RCEF 2490]